MKKIAKIISLLLVLAIFAAMAIGSGSSSSSDSNNASSTSGSSEKSASASSTKKAEPAVPETTIEEAVLFDQDGIRITAKSLDLKGTFGPEINFLIENDSSQSVTVQVRNCSVNGYMVETMMSADVATGKKANDSLKIMRSSLAEADISTIADIEFSFHIFDSSTWNTIIDSEPLRIETSAASGYDYAFDDSGEQVYNENGIEIVVKGLSKDGSLFGPSVLVYLSNTGSSNVTVQVRDVSVNGFMVDSMFSCDLPAGKHAIDTITFLESDLKENEIESIDTVELSFHIFDMDNWGISFDTAPVTLSFS